MYYTRIIWGFYSLFADEEPVSIATATCWRSMVVAREFTSERNGLWLVD